MTALAERPQKGVTSSPPTMPISNITVHPQHRRQDLGKLRDLQQSIRKEGLIRPVPVTTDGALIAGERRLRACQNLGWDRIPVIIANDGAHAVQLLAAEEADTGPHRKPRSATELVLLGLAVEEFERNESEKRRADGQKGIRAARRGQSRDAATQITGLSQHYYTQIRRIVQASLGYEPNFGGYGQSPVDPGWARHSKEVLTVIDRVVAGERIDNSTPGGRKSLLTVNAVYEQWNAAHAQRRKAEAKKNSFSTTEEPAATPIRHRAQREALLKGLASLNGLCNGLASITEIDPAVTSEEAAALDRDLSHASQVLRGLRLKIKEYANGIG